MLPLNHLLSHISHLSFIPAVYSHDILAAACCILGQTAQPMGVANQSCIPPRLLHVPYYVTRLSAILSPVLLFNIYSFGNLKTAAPRTPMIWFTAFLFQMVVRASMYNVLLNASRAYESGDFDKAERIFADSFDSYISTGKFQTEYINFLIKTGKYTKALQMKDRLTEDNKKKLEQVNEYVEILQSRNEKRVEELTTASPNNLEVAIWAAEVYLKRGDMQSHKKWFAKASSLSPQDRRVLWLSGYYGFLTGNYESAIRAYRSVGLKNAADSFEALYKQFKEISGAFSANALSRFEKTRLLYAEVLKRKTKDSQIPSIYDHLELTVLESLIKLGIVHKMPGVLTYARKYVARQKNANSIASHIRAMTVEKLPPSAIANQLEAYKKELTAQLYKDLCDLIDAYKEQEKADLLARQKQQAQQERQRQQQERQRQQQAQQRQAAATPKAGTDFLEYYKALDSTNRTNQADLKKAFKKKQRQAAKLKNPEKRTEGLKKINKAYEILSNEEHKRLYDAGVDPERPQQYGGHGGGAAGFQNINLDDIFGGFFNQGGGQNVFFSSGFGNGGRQQQYYRNYSW